MFGVGQAQNLLGQDQKMTRDISNSGILDERSLEPQPLPLLCTFAFLKECCAMSSLQSAENDDDSFV